MKIPHPGFFLKEHMDGLTANALAKQLKVTPPRIYGILNETRRVSPEMALRFARYFGGSAEMWLKWQSAWDLAQVPPERLEKIRQTVRPYEPDD